MARCAVNASFDLNGEENLLLKDGPGCSQARCRAGGNPSNGSTFEVLERKPKRILDVRLHALALNQGPNGVIKFRKGNIAGDPRVNDGSVYTVGLGQGGVEQLGSADHENFVFFSARIYGVLKRMVYIYAGRLQTERRVNHSGDDSQSHNLG